MSTVQTTARELSPEARAALIGRAAAALRGGGVVVLPTETVYGIAASAASRGAMERLAALVRREEEWNARQGGAGAGASPPFSTWHAPSVAVARAVLRLSHPVHRRLVARLAPGAVRFLVEMSPEELARVERELGALPGVMTGVVNGAGVAALRVPDQEITAAVIEQAKVPVVADRLAATGWGSDRDPSAALADERATRAGVACVIDDGPARLGRTSTTVRLTLAGGYEVVDQGAYEERYIRKRLERNLLFVCTGNTCRSPMAEMIARAELAELKDGIPTRVSSAGIAASSGEPATPEGLEALREMGIDTPAHRSRELTRQLIAEADGVYAMTQSHAQSILSIDPTAGPKVRTLDPAGGDIPDPIGSGPEVYRKTAERLRGLIRARLGELAE